jgi:hypothetical protein
LQLDVAANLQQLAGQVGQSSDARDRKGEGAGLFLRLRDQLRQGVDAELGIDPD